MTMPLGAGNSPADTACGVQTLTAPSDEAVNPEALVKTFFRTEIGTPFSNGGQHDTEESLREFMRALEADMVSPLFGVIQHDVSCAVSDLWLFSAAKPHWTFPCLRLGGDILNQVACHIIGCTHALQVTVVQVMAAKALVCFLGSEPLVLLISGCLPQQGR